MSLIVKKHRLILVLQAIMNVKIAENAVDFCDNNQRQQIGITVLRLEHIQSDNPNHQDEIQMYWISSVWNNKFD